MNEAPTLASVANRRRALFLAAGALTWFLLVAPVLPASRQLGERDTARLFYPVERTVAAALRAGRFPFWDARIESGASILGQVDESFDISRLKSCFERGETRLDFLGHSNRT